MRLKFVWKMEKMMIEIEELKMQIDGNNNYQSMIALTDLDVYNLAEELSDKVWNDYDQWPKKAQWTIGLQVIRAEDSIAANLAEGYGRFTAPDRKKFYLYSRGSFEETKTWLRKARRRGLISEEKDMEYNSIVEKLGPKLNGFINSTHK